MRVAIDTHGCRLNQAESDAIAAALHAQGHALVGELEQAECYVLNTCTITAEADADARAAIRRATRRNPSLRIVVTGCHATAAPDLLAAMPGVSAVIGNLEKQRLEPLVAALAQVRDPSGPAWVSVERLRRRERPSVWQHAPATAPDRTRPLLEVQDGCDLQCSFCIVPQVRGRSRSLPLARAIEQLASLIDHPEVVLTGAHLGLWGRELDPSSRRASRLGELVAGLLAAHPSARLRLGSVDPHEVEDDLIALLGRGVDPQTGAGLCQHVHLPVQSGADEVLRAMRRAHDVGDLERLIPKLRAAAPGIAIGTDVIVGFPGERDEYFERTLALFERLAIPLAHVFVWSPRAGTPAIDLPDRVAPELAAKRSTALRERVASSRRRFLLAMLEASAGERSAVIQRRRDRRSGKMIAFTDNAIDVRLDGPDDLLGRRALLRLDCVEESHLRGRLA
ncbi:MiaB/RimO family radical SAM methylthiotransferase [Nannocystaceae bacterium ST9]